MVITLPEVEVRSGPTTQYYATSKLKYGDKVLVLRESEQQKGWLAIKPPRGSFSWIDAKLIKQIDANNGVVIQPAGARVLIGSSVVGNAPNVYPPFTIPLGSIVAILDKGKTADGVTWLPIQPWHQEVRFIPGDAVQTRQYANNNSANMNGARGGYCFRQPADRPGGPSLSGGEHPAGKAALPGSRRQNHRLLPKGLLLQSSDEPVANPGSPAQAPGHPTQMAQASTWSVGQTASFSQTAAAAQKLVYPAHWSQVGVLRRAQFDIEGQPTYYLEAKGGLLIYATCQPGTTLRDYIGRTVSLYGTTTYRSNEYMRTHVMNASLVATY